MFSYFVCFGLTPLTPFTMIGRKLKPNINSRSLYVRITKVRLFIHLKTKESFNWKLTEGLSNESNDTMVSFYEIGYATLHVLEIGKCEIEFGFELELGKYFDYQANQYFLIIHTRIFVYHNFVCKITFLLLLLLSQTNRTSRET